MSAATSAPARPAPPVPPADAVDNAAWEAAYRRFETPDREVAKFERRLRRLGAGAWPRTARITELFCGRGHGLVALARLGFTDLTGVDLSASLLAAPESMPAAWRRVRADCRALPLADASAEVVVIQGGLHHLARLPEDLDRVLEEVRRILVAGGRLVVVEPWDTPFLRLVHRACANRRLRRVWPRLDALATMIEEERTTYEAWLARPDLVRSALDRRFTGAIRRVGWGKLMYVGCARTEGS